MVAAGVEPALQLIAAHEAPHESVVEGPLQEGRWHDRGQAEDRGRRAGAWDSGASLDVAASELEAVDEDAVRMRRPRRFDGDLQPRIDSVEPVQVGRGPV
ncbi:MAG: hypothetical protein M3163_06210 [Actinomycetota bacterium]|nr:hypothetical protein [Actinomycetota bacterium]